MPDAGKWRHRLDLASVVAMLAASLVLAGAAIYRTLGFTEIPEPTSRSRIENIVPVLVTLSGAKQMGDSEAQFVLLQFADFNCRYCARFAQETLPEVSRTYVDSGKLLFAFRHFILGGTNGPAADRGHAAECAHQQGGFWPVHDLLYRTSSTPSEWASWQLDSSIDAASIRRCVESRSAAAAVQQDLDIAKQLAVRVTPTFFAGVRGADGKVELRHRILGAASIADIAAVLDGMVTKTLR